MLEIERCKSFVIRSCKDLRFTTEYPTERRLQFLDLNLDGKNGLCWGYKVGRPKPLLSAMSAHSKFTKLAIVKSAFVNAVKKSCTHRIGNAVLNQCDRLRNAFYDDGMLRVAMEKILCNCVVPSGSYTVSKKRIIVPYYHGFSHRLLKFIPNSVTLVFTIPYKLARLTPFSGEQVSDCEVRHRKMYVKECISNV